jgi:hypothetical protein
MQKSNLITITAAILTAVLCISGNLLAYSGDGDGTPENPYQISTVEDWQQLMATPDDWGSSFILTDDINLAGVTLTPVGNAGINFTGIFDGNDNIISNADINQPSDNCVGMFGFVGPGGQIRNLGVEDVNVTGGNYVGGLVGYNYGTLTSCYSTGSVSGFGYVGGFVGYNANCEVSNCYSTCNVSGNNRVGGFVGTNNDSGIITYCHADGTIICDSGSYCVGGLVGENGGGSSVTSSYATGAVSGGFIVGGLVGTVSWPSSVISCYATGDVTSLSQTIGGLAGVNDGTLYLCNASGSVTAVNRVGGLVGVNSNSITSCHADGDVTGASYNVGGLVGENGGWATVSSSYATGNVGGDSALGGLVGSNDWLGGVISCYATGTVNGTSAYIGGLVGLNGGGVYSCYAIGPVSGPYVNGAPWYTGGLVGENDNLVSASFWDINTSGQGSGVGYGSSDGVTSKNTSEMKIQSTFTSAGWDFLGETVNGTDDIWRMCVDGVSYPRLTWEYARNGDFACPDGVNFVDFAYFAPRWLTAGCSLSNNFCGGADMDFSGTVDMLDLKLFADNWLKGF